MNDRHAVALIPIGNIAGASVTLTEAKVRDAAKQLGLHISEVPSSSGFKGGDTVTYFGNHPRPSSSGVGQFLVMGITGHKIYFEYYKTPKAKRLSRTVVISLSTGGVFSFSTENLRKVKK